MECVNQIRRPAWWTLPGWRSGSGTPSWRTVTAGALEVWGLWVELAYLRPYWQVLLTDYGWVHQDRRRGGGRDGHGRRVRRSLASRCATGFSTF